MALKSERERLVGVSLTAREREVLCLIMRGYTDQEIAQRLCISSTPSTAISSG